MSGLNFYVNRVSKIIRQVSKAKSNEVEKYYAVAVGRRIGIYKRWRDCKSQIEGVSNAKYQSFATRKDAVDYVNKMPKEAPISLKEKFIPKSDNSKNAVVFADGSCWMNGYPSAVAGIGVYWPGKEEMNVSETIDGRQTSIRAELLAVIRALRQAKEMGVDCLTVYTDSRYVTCVGGKWLWSWKENDWKISKGREVINKQDYIDFHDAIIQLKKVKWRFVKSHCGIHGNEVADRLANDAVAQYFKQNPGAELLSSSVKRMKAYGPTQADSKDSSDSGDSSDTSDESDSDIEQTKTPSDTKVTEEPKKEAKTKKTRKKR